VPLLQVVIITYGNEPRALMMNIARMTLCYGTRTLVIIASHSLPEEVGGVPEGVGGALYGEHEDGKVVLECPDVVRVVRVRPQVKDGVLDSRETLLREHGVVLPGVYKMPAKF